MEFAWSAEADAVGAEARTLFETMVTDELRARVVATGTSDDPDLRRALAATGWLTAHWPAGEGGRGWDGLSVAPLFEEAGRRAAPIEGYLNTLLVAELLRRFGSAEQRSSILPALVSGQSLVALGISEPDSGSDAAAARTRAVRDGDRWVITGQKMYTTYAEVAQYVFLLARTNTEVPKHRGLTTFLIPLDAPGVQVEAIRTLGGERTNITYYTDVSVADGSRVGDVDDGWAMIGHVLRLERGVFPVVPGRCARLLDQAVAWAAATPGVAGGRRLDDDDARERLASIAVTNEVGRLLALRTVAAHAEGRVPVVEGSMTKLFTTEMMQTTVEQLLDLVGPEGLVAGGEPGAVQDGAFERAFRHAPLETITGGTSEIQRDIIANGLGLPRSR
jgi:alkylation response protein AidB-like acyl-CoA dehydrogenase